MLTKNWIEQNLFTKTNKINNRICLESWWITRNYTSYLKELQEKTSFLPADSSITERVYCIYNKISQNQSCSCGNTVSFKNFQVGYREYCSIQCATHSEKRNQKISKNKNIAKMLETTKKTNMEKYGVEHFFQSETAKEKVKKTKLEKYGVASYNNYEKAKKTNMEKYGVVHAAQIPDVILKIQNKKNKLPQLRDKDWLLDQNKTKSITQIAKELNVTYRTVYLWFQKHNIEINFFSPDFGIQQKEIYDFITSLGISNIKLNDRNIIKPKEIDIFLPEYNLGIEYNGMYWHSQDKYRHIEKTNMCMNKNIKLLQIWDTEWITQKDIVKSIIKSNLGMNEKIYARKCKIQDISSNVYKVFLDENHIQGNVNSSIRYGLYYDDVLVSVIGLGKSRFDKNYSHELLRFCNKIDYNVVGGFSKLLNHCIKTHQIDSIQTFCDLRLFDGNVYETFGFSYSHQSKPGYVYFKQGVVKNRQQFQKHKLKSILDNFDETLSESKNMLQNGWLQVWDCGQKVYFWSNPNKQ